MTPEGAPSPRANWVVRQQAYARKTPRLIPENARTERCHQIGPFPDTSVITVTAPLLTASETPIQIVQR